MAVDLMEVSANLVRTHTGALRAYAGTDVFDHLMQLLSALRMVYLHDLVDVTPADLLAKQGALRQVIALERALSSALVDTPRV